MGRLRPWGGGHPGLQGYLAPMRISPGMVPELLASESGSVRGVTEPRPAPAERHLRNRLPAPSPVCFWERSWGNWEGMWSGSGSRQAYFLLEESLPVTSGKQSGSTIAWCTLTPEEHRAVTVDGTAGLLGVCMSEIQVCLSGHMSGRLSDCWTGHSAGASASCLGSGELGWAAQARSSQLSPELALLGPSPC